MKTKVQKWGNSLALRIPKAFAEESQLAEGTEVEILLQEGGFSVRRKAKKKTYKLASLLAGIRPSNLHKCVDGSGPVGREEW